jgi:hypothetical protein
MVHPERSYTCSTDVYRDISEFTVHRSVTDIPCTVLLPVSRAKSTNSFVVTDKKFSSRRADLFTLKLARS